MSIYFYFRAKVSSTKSEIRINLYNCKILAKRFGNKKEISEIFYMKKYLADGWEWYSIKNTLIHKDKQDSGHRVLLPRPEAHPSMANYIHAP